MNFETQKRLREMLARTGHVLAVEDLDAILELDTLAEKMAGAEGMGREVLARPVFFSGVPCYPLTLAHHQYIGELLSDLCESDDEMVVGLLWLTSEPAITAEMWDARKAKRAIRQFARNCPWTEVDCQAVMALRYGTMNKKTDHDADGADKSDQTGRVLMMLVHDYGADLDYWRYRAPIEMVDAAIADWNERQAEQAQQFRRMNGGAVVLGGAKIHNSRAFRLKADEIEASWQRKKS